MFSDPQTPLWTPRDPLTAIAIMPLLLLTRLVLLRASPTGEVASDDPIREWLCFRYSVVTGISVPWGHSSLIHISAVFFPSLSLPFKAYIMASLMLALASCCTESSSSLGSHRTEDSFQFCFFDFLNTLLTCVEIGFHIVGHRNVRHSPGDITPISPPQMVPSTMVWALYIFFHHVRHFFFFIVLNIKTKALLMLGKHFTTKLHHQPRSSLFLFELA